MKNKLLSCSVFAFFAFALFASLEANNLQLLGKARMLDRDPVTGTTYINFRAQWENSWRTSTPDNWDAVWFFVKFKHNETKWEHVFFDTNDNVHQVSANVPLEVKVGKTKAMINGHSSTRGAGVFVQRKQIGRGNVTIDNLSLKWNYITQLNEKNVEYTDGPISLRVYAIEMVYVPRGSFYFGHNGTTASDITVHSSLGLIYPHAHHNSHYGGIAAPYIGAMPLVYLSDLTASATEASKWKSSATYPNGFEAFYIMKYELTQHGYADFLNTLTYEQQMKRAANAAPNLDNYARFYSDNRNMLTVRLPGLPEKSPNPSSPALYALRHAVETGHDWDLEFNGGNIAMSYLNWADCAAYLAWAGLRPLTEFEYEKTCRGIYPPLKNEYAWGTSEKVDIPLIVPVNAFRTNEKSSASNANFVPQIGAMANYFPMRVGCFATEVSTREDAGAAYYGAMNMSDNVSEIYINCNTQEGLQFDGSHGYGEIDAVTALPLIHTWPIFNAPSKGLGIKGIHSSDVAFVSARGNMNNTTILNNINNRYHLLGCRGGRTAEK